jgi:hypothetical protein
LRRKGGQGYHLLIFNSSPLLGYKNKAERGLREIFIMKMKRMEELNEHIANAPLETLVVFDVDHVLTMPADPLLQMPTAVKHRHLIEPLFAALSSEELAIAYTLAITEGEQVIVEEEILSILKNIAEKGHRAIALTALQVIELQTHNTSAHWRVKELSRLGFNLKDSFAEADPFYLDHFEMHLGRHPEYREGVLFSNNKQDKGTVLRAFLEKVNYRPNHIIFVDDLVDNLVDVQRTADEMGISCVALHYLGAYGVATPEVASEGVLRKWEDLGARAKDIVKRLNSAA